MFVRLSFLAAPQRHGGTSERFGISADGQERKEKFLEKEESGKD